jgi:hypothetical protein
MHAVKGMFMKAPEGVVPPMCACGCEESTKWMPGHGWATYKKGHGTAKVNGMVRKSAPPKCSCGCGGSVKYQGGVGWRKWIMGHNTRCKPAYRRIPEETIRKIRELRVKGLTYTKIAEATNVSRSYAEIVVKHRTRKEVT